MCCAAGSIDVVLYYPCTYTCAQSLVGKIVDNVDHFLSCGRYGFTEIELGVGLFTLADEGSFEASFLSKFESQFSADVIVWW